MAKTISPLTVTVIPRGSGRSRTFVIRKRQHQLLRVAGAILALSALALIVSWFWLLQRARTAAELEAEVAIYAEAQAGARELAERLSMVEAEYERLRSVYTHVESGEGDPWLVLDDGGRPAEAPLRAAGETASLPSQWPLAAAGFVTRAAGGGETEHPGIDIAVATGTWVRAAGGGIVEEVGSDDIYGSFVIIDHGGELHTQYAHLSTSFVAAGAVVRAGEVIALAGTTGLSTAPHLHFEVRLEGINLNPLDFVTHPGER